MSASNRLTKWRQLTAAGTPPLRMAERAAADLKKIDTDPVIVAETIGCRVEIRPLLKRGLGAEAVTFTSGHGFRMLIDDQPGPSEPTVVGQMLGNDGREFRVRFRAAHELGHLLFFRGDPPSRSRPADDAEERWCDRFAAAFLVDATPRRDDAVLSPNASIDA